MGTAKNKSDKKQAKVTVMYDTMIENKKSINYIMFIQLGYLSYIRLFRV